MCVDHLDVVHRGVLRRIGRFHAERLGFRHLIDVQSRPEDYERQRQRFIERYMADLTGVGMTGFQPFREAVREPLSSVTRVAMQELDAHRSARAVHPIGGPHLDMGPAKSRGLPAT